jgi:hypothetical protein
LTDREINTNPKTTPVLGVFMPERGGIDLSELPDGDNQTATEQTVQRIEILEDDKSLILAQGNNLIVIPLSRVRDLVCQLEMKAPGVRRGLTRIKMAKHRIEMHRSQDAPAERIAQYVLGQIATARRTPHIVEHILDYLTEDEMQALQQVGGATPGSLKRRAERDIKAYNVALVKSALVDPAMANLVAKLAPAAKKAGKAKPAKRKA